MFKIFKTKRKIFDYSTVLPSHTNRVRIKTKNTNFVNNLNVEVGSQPRAIDPAVEQHRKTVQFAVKKIVDEVAKTLNKKLKVRYGN